MINSSLLTFLNYHKIFFECNVNLSSFSYFKTGGLAKLIIFPNSLLIIPKLIKFLDKSKIHYKIIGDTSNLLFLDNTNYSCLISVNLIDKIFINRSNILEVDCGVPLPFLSRFALKNSLSGFAGLEGIPGRLGGAIFMNAGAYGDTISDNLISVNVLNHNYKVINLKTSELKFRYRNSIFKSENCNFFILKAFFKCIKTDKQSIYRAMSLYHSKRHKYQEFCYPTLGSIYSGSVYRILAKKNFIFGLISRFYFLTNYKIKLHRRESPLHRIWLNNIAVKLFNIKFSVQSFSDKDLNTLININQGTDEMLKYLQQLEELVGDDAEIENEIVEEF